MCGYEIYDDSSHYIICAICICRIKSPTGLEMLPLVEEDSMMEAEVEESGLDRVDANINLDMFRTPTMVLDSPTQNAGQQDSVQFPINLATLVGVGNDPYSPAQIKHMDPVSTSSVTTVRGKISSKSKVPISTSNGGVSSSGSPIVSISSTSTSLTQTTVPRSLPSAKKPTTTTSTTAANISTTASTSTPTHVTTPTTAISTPITTPTTSTPTCVTPPTAESMSAVSDEEIDLNVS